MSEREDGAALARIAGAIADASRATMLLALLDGRSWTAAELAAEAEVSRPTATEHLHTLVAAGLVEERREGRHRYLRIADPSAAALIEQLAAQTMPSVPRPSWRAIDADARLREARTCYDHIAGTLGTQICEAFTARGLLEPDGVLRLTDAGHRWCADNQVDVDARTRGRRPEVLLCLDWTERRDHLAGALGAALLDAALAAKWVERTRPTRALRITPQGRTALQDALGIV